MAGKNLSTKSHDKRIEKIRKLWHSGDRQNAVNQCQDILRHNPQYAPAHLVYAELLRDNGNAQEAAKHYQAACSLPDTTAGCFLGFARFLKQAGQPQNAQEVLSVGFKKWPRNVQIARELGVVFAENDQHFHARQAFEHCLQLKPDDWICWNHLGCSHAQDNQAKKAIECFDKSLAFARNSRWDTPSKQDMENISLNKASALIYAGETDAARQMFEVILATNPESHRAWSDLSSLTKCTPEA